MDLSQDSDIEYVGTIEPGYNKARSDRVNELLKFYCPPDVSLLTDSCVRFSIIIRILYTNVFIISLSSFQYLFI